LSFILAYQVDHPADLVFGCGAHAPILAEEGRVCRVLDRNRIGNQVIGALTDGGVYDNLGLAPLWPDRDPSVSFNVEPVDTIICCRAGYGLRHDPPSQFLIARLKSTIACIHDRAQNAAMKRLLELREAGKLRAVVLLYLGQDDRRLKYKPADLVTREEVYAYPTDFSAMSEEWIGRLSRRGEQLARALIAEHAPELIEPSATPDAAGVSTPVEADADNAEPPAAKSARRRRVLQQRLARLTL
jgi:hypothetical protein